LNTSDEDLIGTREVAGIGTKRETVTNVYHVRSETLERRAESRHVSPVASLTKAVLHRK
jgi:hypothetical protein